MAWCRVSSLTAAVTRALGNARFPLPRNRIIQLVHGRSLEGWELDHFLSQALRRGRYNSLREVLADLDSWIEEQG